MLNKVIIMGRLTRDPEIKKVNNDISVCSFSIACDRDIVNKQNNERETDFFDVTAWRSTADFVGKYFGKGRMIVVVGRLQKRNYTDIMVFYKSPPPYHPQMTVGEKNHTKGKAVGKQAEDVHSNRSYGNYTLVESPDGNMKYPASIWRFPKPHPSVALHATEKPVDLLRYAIRTYTDRNAIVLDNCCGTGSTLIAAKLEGRRYIGIDNGVCDKKKSPYYGMPWAQVAQIRLEAIDHEPADEPERHRPLGEGTTEGVCTPSGVSA